MTIISQYFKKAHQFSLFLFLVISKILPDPPAQCVNGPLYHFQPSIVSVIQNIQCFAFIISIDLIISCLWISLEDKSSLSSSTVSSILLYLRDRDAMLKYGLSLWINFCLFMLHMALRRQAFPSLSKGICIIQVVLVTDVLTELQSFRNHVWLLFKK